MAAARAFFLGGAPERGREVHTRERDSLPSLGGRNAVILRKDGRDPTGPGDRGERPPSADPAVGTVRSAADLRCLDGQSAQFPGVRRKPRAGGARWSAVQSRSLAGRLWGSEAQPAKEVDSALTISTLQFLFLDL